MPLAFADAFDRSCSHRQTLFQTRGLTAYRLFDGAGDGIAGIYIDRYGPAAVFNVYDDAGWDERAIGVAADGILARLRPNGVESVYVKHFTKDRSRLGGQAPDESFSATPRAGVEQPEWLTVEEYGTRFEVRPYDGFSTGLFLEHRDHRCALAGLDVKRAVNLFAYTCAFSVPLVAAGAQVTNVDVSARYLDWGRRNHKLNLQDDSRVKFVRMDAMAYLQYAARHAEQRFDLVILDPPTFGAGNSRRKIKAWKATSDYPKLLKAAAQVVTPGGLIFAATNTRELAEGAVFRTMIERAIGRVEWQELPPWPIDVRERGRVAAALFRPRAGATPPRRSPHRAGPPTRTGGHRARARARR
jgi:23S rRNA G2069 N7-methylase RlmK/C1962 C5-methylase RlmI